MTILQQISSENPFGSLLVDSGNALFPRPSAVDTDSENGVIARGILRIYKEMGYDAVNIGPNDMAAGLSFLQGVEAPPLVSANFFDDEGRELFLPLIQKRIGPLVYGITGVTRKPNTLENAYHYREWQEVLPDILKTLDQRSDFIILLSTLDAADNAAIAERFPQIRLILTAGTGSKVSGGADNGAVFAQTMNRGRHLGHLRINHPEYGQWQSNEQEQIIQLKQHLDILTKRAEEYRQRSSDEVRQNDQTRLKRLEERIDSLLGRLERLEQAQPGNSELPASTYTLRHIPLTSNIAEHPQIDAMIEAIHREVKILNDQKRK